MPVFKLILDETLIVCSSINELLIKTTSLPMQGLTMQEQGRCLKFKSEKRQREFVAGRYLARQCLAQLTHTLPENWLIERNDQGAPIVICQEQHDSEATHLSISHTESFCAVAVSNKAIGIDLQMIESASRWLAIKNRVFSDCELADIADLNDEERSMRLTELWAIKEAFGKFHGTGLKPKANTQLSFSPKDFNNQSKAVSFRSDNFIFSIVKQEINHLVDAIDKMGLNGRYWVLSKQ